MDIQVQRHAARDDAFRAIGRYTVAFSALVAEMRNLIARRIGKGLGGDEWIQTEMALGYLHAADISRVFFALCRDVAEFSAAESEIERQLAKEIEDGIIHTRNDFAHGDWEVAGIPFSRETGIGGEPIHVLGRIVPHRKIGPFSRRKIEVKDIDAMTDRLLEVTTMTVEFGKLALGIPLIRREPASGGTITAGELRVQDIFEVPGSTKPKDQPAPSPKPETASKRAQVTRTGPLASEIVVYPYVS